MPASVSPRLFLYLGTTQRNTTGATITILFGSMFVIRASMIPVFVALSLLALAVVALLYRPLLLSTLSPDIASARGVPVRAVGVGYLLAMAVAVSLSCVTIGAILSHRGADRPGRGSAAADETAWLRRALGGRHRPRGHLAGHPARLRQLLLAAGREKAGP